MITFQEETYKTIISYPQFVPLLMENWGETEIFNMTKKLAPKLSIYKSLADQNILKLYSVKDDDILVGYFVSFIMPHQHYADVIVAETDTFFISEKYRKGLLGYKFLQYVVKNLKQKVGIIFLTMNVKKDLSKLLTRLNFKLTDYKYSLEI